MYNIIFLDIDGVLNGYNYISFLSYKLACILNIKNLYRKWVHPFSVEQLRVKRLAKIVKKTNAKIVMSSSWRGGFWNVPYDNKTNNQKKLTNLLNKYNIEVIGITPNCGKRSEEILTWISKNKDKVKNFIILDDEVFDLGGLEHKLVQTSKVKKGEMIKGHYCENTGLKRKHIKQAINLLNK